MSQPHDIMERRERDMAAWLDSVAHEKRRLYGWTTEETIDRSTIDRSTWYRWKKIRKYGNMPESHTVAAFCQSLGLDPSVPFRILGYSLPKSAGTTPDPDPPSEIDMLINRLKAAISSPGIGVEHRRELEIKLVRLLAAQQDMEAASADAHKELRRRRGA